MNRSDTYRADLCNCTVDWNVDVLELLYVYIDGELILPSSNQILQPEKEIAQV